VGATDPIYTGNEPLSDSLVAAITGAIGMTLLDRTGGGILANPVIGENFMSKDRFVGALAGNIVRVAWGADKYATTAEGSDFTVLDLASDIATVTPARRGFARQISDMARSLGQMDIVAWSNFAAESTIAWQQTVVSVLAALFTSISATGGNSGGAASWGVLLADKITLGIALVPPPYVFITRAKDWGAMSQDALSLGGAIAQDPESLRFKSAVNPGFKGTFLNGEVDVYVTDELPTSGGDTVSGLFGRGHQVWNAHMPAPSPATNPLLWTPLYGVETERVILKSDDQIAYSTHLGASIDINAAGIKMLFLT